MREFLDVLKGFALLACGFLMIGLVAVVLAVVVESLGAK